MFSAQALVIQFWAGHLIFQYFSFFTYKRGFGGYKLKKKKSSTELMDSRGNHNGNDNIFICTTTYQNLGVIRKVIVIRMKCICVNEFI